MTTVSTPTLITDCIAATMEGDGFGLIEDAAILIKDGRISWVGGAADAPSSGTATEVRSLGGRLVTPGLVDCHTHLVFGGERSAEFAARIAGASYEEIAAAGGGIRSTVAATRDADRTDLLASAQRRLMRLNATGATTVEIKSGYGLDLETELEMLRIARHLGETTGVRVVTTLLAAHVVPEQWSGNADGYIDHIIEVILPAAIAEDLVDAVDAFCERIAFSPAQVDRLFTAARRYGVPVKLHGAQLSSNDGVDVAVRHGALSIDHLEHATDSQVASMADAGTVAVLIPGATHTLQETTRPPVAALRRHGVPIALATDLNPGTSPVADLALVCNMGALLYGLTPEECLAGVTRHGAAALGLSDRGALSPGLRADLAVWDVAHPAEISYWTGMDLCVGTWIAGSERPARRG